MWSKKKKRKIKYIKFDIYLEDEEESVEEIVTCCIYSDINNNLYEIGEDFTNLKTHFCYKTLTKPFQIMISYCCVEYEDSDIIDTESEEETHSIEETITTDKTFKSDECIICLTNPPNVLFCNCGHIAIRVECDKVKSLNVCPVCKFENTIKRKWMAY